MPLSFRFLMHCSLSNGVIYGIKLGDLFEVLELEHEFTRLNTYLRTKNLENSEILVFFVSTIMFSFRPRMSKYGDNLPT